MNLLKTIKKGQALPLNTIVIAILVIIVMLVIIVFFTDSLSQSGDALKEQSATKCDINNPAIKFMKYTKVTDHNLSESVCPEGSPIIGVSNCCGIK